MFFVVMIIILIILLLAIFYNLVNIQRIKLFNKIDNKTLKWIISCIPFAILYLVFNSVNFVSIVLHLFLILLLFNLINFVFKNKLSKSTISIAAISFCFIYMLVGAYNAYHIRQTNYNIETSKDLKMDSLKIIQLSDAHVGTTFDGDGLKEHLKKISKLDSDIVVITGDFIDDDTSKEDIIKSCNALSLLKPKYGVYFIYGNHDKGYYSDKEILLKEYLEKNNVKILEDEVELINDNIYLIGREDRRYSRKTISDLTKDLDKSKYMIVLNHQPNDYKNESEDGVDLVLSGHTHGGQFFPLGYVGILLKQNDNWYGLKKINNTSFIVNSGLSSWAIDFKTGTFSEYVVIDVTNKGNNYE